MLEIFGDIKPIPSIRRTLMLYESMADRFIHWKYFIELWHLLSLIYTDHHGSNNLQQPAISCKNPFDSKQKKIKISFVVVLFDFSIFIFKIIYTNGKFSKYFSVLKTFDMGLSWVFLEMNEKNRMDMGRKIKCPIPNLNCSTKIWPQKKTLSMRIFKCVKT